MSTIVLTHTKDKPETYAICDVLSPKDDLEVGDE